MSAVPRLIINADDFGYFDGVSAGILQAANAGVVTATGVLANSPDFAQAAAVLRRHPQIDVGVHLNATHGSPLTAQFAARQSSTVLPNKSSLAARLLTGRLPAAVIETEWRAQIRRCLDAGLQIRFLNSHEHIHMLPQLYRVTVGLAREFGVSSVRYTSGALEPAYGYAPLLSSLALRLMSRNSAPQPGTPGLLGLSPSGRINMAYVRRVLPRLRPGNVYELMCHPGQDDPATHAHPKLRRYHDWGGELQCLLSGEFRAELARHAIQLVRYRDLARAGFDAP
jgi:predicted glycoside hydrolase/deacetylase ChbG (UPF0249 family)